ncbi:MAG: C-Myc-responsive protein Rcl [Erysipelotrichaceae bacterium]|nr:C-Myc-responsive protein Rcl [Erysipelotrichaceae bacterium]
MNKKVYFAGSIRGGQEDTAFYHEIISMIDQTDHVLTEQVGDIHHNALEHGRSKDQAIYDKDTAWLRECDLVIAECTHPSLGVGYEMAYAEKNQKPVYIFYRHSEVQLSAMLTGDPYFHIQSYETKEELWHMISEILK